MISQSLSSWLGESISSNFFWVAFAAAVNASPLFSSRSAETFSGLSWAAFSIAATSSDFSRATFFFWESVRLVSLLARSVPNISRIAAVLFPK